MTDLKKKFATLIAFALFSCTVFATTGPYMGMGLGYSNTIFNLSAIATVRADGITKEHHKTFQGTAGGVQGQLVAGYAYDINKFNLATELTFQFPKTSYSNTINEDTFYYKFYYAYGVNLVPSYCITKHSSIYLKFGVTRGKFASEDMVDSDPHIAAWNTSFYTTGFNVGVGDAIYLTKHLRVRLEYLYTNYQTYKFHHTILDMPLPDPSPIRKIYLDVDAKIHPEIHTFMLGLDYQFDLF